MSLTEKELLAWEGRLHTLEGQLTHHIKGHRNAFEEVIDMPTYMLRELDRPNDDGTAPTPEQILERVKQAARIERRLIMYFVDRILLGQSRYGAFDDD